MWIELGPFQTQLTSWGAFTQKSNVTRFDTVGTHTALQTDSPSLRNTTGLCFMCNSNFNATNIILYTMCVCFALDKSVYQMPKCEHKLTLAASCEVRVATFSCEASSSRRSFLICCWRRSSFSLQTSVCTEAMEKIMLLFSSLNGNKRT